MEEIKGSYLSSLRVNEQIGLLKQVITILRKFNVSTLELEAELLRLEGSTDQFEKSTSVLSEKEKTLELEEADGVVDAFVSSMKGYLKSLARNPKPEKNQPAGYLLGIFQQQGWGVEALPYEAESAVISKVDGIFKSNAAAAKALKDAMAEPFWDDVMEAEAKFLEIQQKRVVSAAEKATVMSSVVARREAQNACKALFKKINAFATVSPKPEYGQMINQINEIIEGKRAQLLARHTLAGKK